MVFIFPAFFLNHYNKVKIFFLSNMSVCSSKNHPDYCDCPQEVYDAYSKSVGRKLPQPVVISDDDESASHHSVRSERPLDAPTGHPVTMFVDPAIAASDRFCKLARAGRFSTIVKVFKLRNVPSSDPIWGEMVKLRVYAVSTEKRKRLLVEEELAQHRMREAFSIKM